MKDQLMSAGHHGEVAMDHKKNQAFSSFREGSKTKQQSLLRGVMLSVIMMLCFNVSFAQTYYQVYHSGDGSPAVVNGVTVGYSQSGSTGWGSECGDLQTRPYCVLGSVGSGWTFTFSPAISSVRLHMVMVASGLIGGTEVAHVLINGVPYTVTNGHISGATSPNSCGDPTVLTTSGGNIINGSAGSIPTGVITLTPGTPITSLTITNTGSATSGFWNFGLFLDGPVPPANITGTFTVCPGATTTLSDATTGGTWSSSNTGIATIDGSGVVTAVAAGTTTISYTNGGGSATQVVTVNSLPTVSAITGNTTLSTAITTQLSNTTTGGTWTSSTLAVGTVNSSTGLVTGLTVGTSSISYTVTSLGCSTTVTTNVTVNTPAVGINFDGINDHVSIGTNVTNLNNGDFTIEAWIKTSSTGMAIVTCSNTNTAWELGEKAFYVDPSTGRLNFVGHNCGYIVGNYAVNDGAWHHAAVTWDYIGGTSGTGKIYVDGVDRTASSGYSANVGNLGTFYIGRPNFGEVSNYFNGSIDEVRIWNVARTQSEIQANMNCDVAQNGNLLAYYRFDNGIANGTNTGNNLAVDYSGNNNCGTINNMPLTGTSSNYVTGAVGNCNSITLVAAITGTASVCLGASTTLSDATSGGTWSSSTPAVGTVSAGGVVNALTAGTTTISYTVCGVTVTRIVTVNALPTVASITGNTTLSTAITTQLSNITAGGAWASSNTAVGTVSSSTGLVSGLTAGTSTISYTVTTLGCSTTVTTNVTVNTPGNGLALDGSDDVVVVSGSNGYSLSNKSFSFECWAKRGGTEDYLFFLGQGTTTTSQGLHIGFRNTSVLTFAFWNDDLNVSGSFGDNNWHHYAFTFDDATLQKKVYRDGVLIGSGTASNHFTAGASDLYIGATFNGNNFKGSMDEVRIWNTVRSQAEITANMNCDVAQNANLVRYYRFDNGSAGGTNTTQTTTPDYSGNLKCGTLTNFALTGTTSNYATGAVGTCSAITLVQAITGTASACPGTTTTLSDATIGGTWSSSNTSVGTVDATTGIVSGLTAGTTNIIYTVCGATVTRIVTVNPLPTVPPITGNTTLSTAITTKLSDVTTTGTWASSNTAVATVNAGTGIVNGLTAGTSRISYTVTTLGCSTLVTTNVTVNTPNVSVNFDGTDDRIDGTNSALPQGSAARTIEAWVKTTTTAGSQVIFNWGSFSANQRSGLLLSGNHLYFVGESNDFGAGAALVPTNVWTHVAVTLTGTTLQFYVNGVLRQNGSLSTPPATTGSSWSISNTNNYAPTREPFAGSIDEIRVWNTVRTQAEIAANMNCDVAQQTGLVAYYRFDNGVAGGTNTSNDIAVDYSGNSGCGTLANMTLTGTSSNYVTGAVGSCNAIPTPFPATFSGNTPVCAGSTITLGNSNTGGVWSTVSSNISLNGTTGVVTGLTAGTALVNYTLNCYVASVIVTVNAQPVVTGTLAVCQGATSVMTSTLSGGTWTSSAPAAATVDASGVVTAVIAGTTTISYTMATGCYDAKSVTVNAYPDVSISLSGSSVFCDGNSATLTAAITGSTLFLNAGNTSGATTVCDCPPGYVAVGLSGSGGSWLDHFTIHCRQLVGGVLTGGYVSTSSNGGSMGGSWQGPYTFSGNTVMVGARVDASGYGTMNGVTGYGQTVSYIGAGGVNSVSPTALPTISGAAFVGTIGTEYAPAGMVITGMYTYDNWFSSGVAFRYKPISEFSTTSTAASPYTWSTGATTNAITVNTSGAYSVSYTSANGCSSTASRGITVNALPAVSASSDVAICIGSNTSLNASGAPSYSWSPASGLSATTGTEVGASPTVTTTYTVTGTNAEGCTDTATVTVTVNALPVVSAGSDVAICYGTSTTLTATGASTYSWSPLFGLSDSAVGASVIASPESTTTYTATGTNTFGCVNTATVTVTVNLLPDAGTIVGDSLVSMGGTTTLTNAAIGTWSGGNSHATVSAAGVVSGLTAGTVTVTFIATTPSCGNDTTTKVMTVSNPVVTGTTCSMYGCDNYADRCAVRWHMDKQQHTEGSSKRCRYRCGHSAGTVNITYVVSGSTTVTVVTVNTTPTAFTGAMSICNAASTTIGSTPSGGTWTSSEPTVGTIKRLWCTRRPVSR
jgi:hypothetical protein